MRVTPSCQFEDVNIYLSSIKTYMYNDDDFNWNYGISQAAVGNYKDAEETLLLVQVRWGKRGLLRK